ncbi:hypothetical protein FNI67_23485, partial [Salmonella enterica subsp. diarizonae]|nr:hypothetical protein [Salmonella enterica subsp. diarizonae]
TILVLDNAPIHRGIDDETRKRWFFEHNMCLLYLPVYSPDLNVIEMVWKNAKYHWRRFINWRKETLESELDKLLGAYGDRFAVNLSWLVIKKIMNFYSLFPRVFFVFSMSRFRVFFAPLQPINGSMKLSHR